jgi:hypothetical protein
MASTSCHGGGGYSISVTPFFKSEFTEYVPPRYATAMAE